MINSRSIIEVKDLSKIFENPLRFQALRDVNFEIKGGEFVSLVGKSGSGKSTLLYCISTMDTDYSGNITIDSVELSTLNGDGLANLRNEKIGFVFQFHYLLPEFSSLMNVMIPALKLKREDAKLIEHRAFELLTLLGISDQALKNTSRLSGGQQQRVAIARSLINAPLILMCDEPTGNLDTSNTDKVLSVFHELSSKSGMTILTVTHDDDFARQSSRVMELSDGVLL
jgi:lipoprotein-releasing system ATP-binding protein